MSSDSIHLEALLLSNVSRILVTLLLTRGRHSINDDEIENVISPPFLPESPPPLDPNGMTYTPTDDEHTSSVKKLRRNLEPRSDSDNESERDIDIIEEPEL